MSRWKEYRKKKHSEYVRRRADEIFTVEELEGKMWFFCNGIGLFPCSHIGLITENEIVKFLYDIRQFYIETE